MGSPKEVVFFVYDASTGAGKTGWTGSLTFDIYINDVGGAISQPTITEVGGGAYKFTPVFPANTPIICIVNGTVAVFPQRQSFYLRPEDYLVDSIQDLWDEVLGKWQIFTTGPDANRLVLYRQDGSVLKKFDLTDGVGAPTYTSPFTRTPV